MLAGSVDGQIDYAFQLERCSTDVHRFVARRVRNAADAEDIAQQTLLLALAKRDDGVQSLGAWLYTIARHLIIDHYRAAQRRRFVSIAAPADQVEPALWTRADAIPVACDCRSRLACWLDCISRHLRLEEQLAVLLADMYGYADKHSAAMIGLSVPSFKLLLHRSRAHLQEHAGVACTLGRQDPGATPGRRCPLGQRGNAAAGGGRVGIIAAGRSSVTARLALRARLLEGLYSDLGFDLRAGEFYRRGVRPNLGRTFTPLLSPAPGLS
jgi:RNA polymerase sigma-70 factor (ECF subfamily)